MKKTHYVSCKFGLVAVLITDGETTTTYFTETDHLGSILGLMDSNGIYIERSSLDAWGRRRNPTDWTYNNIPVSTITDRGYTGHEHLDMFGLINMNGRMYDPVLGRFLGVDPIVQSPDNSLSYNGYAYCLNNPLKYSDPTGYSYYYDPWTDPTHNTIEQEFADLFGGQYYDLLPFGSNYTGVGKPGEGGNGNGLNGIYYDYETEKWRSTWDYSELDPLQISKHIWEIGREFGNNLTSVIFSAERVQWCSLGGIQVTISLFGKMFSEYNWIQTYEHIDLKGTRRLDADGRANHGFYNEDWRLKDALNRAKPGSDNAFFDDPNAVNFNAFMTLVGLKNNRWIPIGTLNWGYSFDTASLDYGVYGSFIKTPYFNIVTNNIPKFHINYVKEILDFQNNRRSLNVH